MKLYCTVMWYSFINIRLNVLLCVISDEDTESDVDDLGDIGESESVDKSETLVKVKCYGTSNIVFHNC